MHAHIHAALDYMYTAASLNSACGQPYGQDRVLVGVCLCVWLPGEVCAVIVDRRACMHAGTLVRVSVCVRVGMGLWGAGRCQRTYVACSGAWLSGFVVVWLRCTCCWQHSWLLSPLPLFSWYMHVPVVENNAPRLVASVYRWQAYTDRACFEVEWKYLHGNLDLQPYGCINSHR